MAANTCVWVLTEGAAGMENQALGLAEAMQFGQIITHCIKLHGLYKWLAPYISWGWRDKEGQFQEPWPNMIIACGRKAITPALWLKRMYNIPVVYIQDPYISTKHFDYVVAPLHDGVRGENVISMLGACHRVSEEKLAKAAQEFKHLFLDNKKPICSFIIGGPNRSFQMPLHIIQEAIGQLTKTQNGDVWVSTSRRTPIEITNYLKTVPNIHLIMPESPVNPYLGLLAYSDICLLTADSVSMVSECIASKASVYLVPLLGKSKKFSKFYDALGEKGLIRWWSNNTPLQTYEKPSCDEVKRVANHVKNVMNSDS